MNSPDEELTLNDSETVERLAGYFARLAELLSSLSGSYSSSRLQDLMFLPWAIASNSKALCLLARNGFGNETFVLLRALIEKLVTFYYLHACEKEEFENYIKYSRQKTIWKMSQHLGKGKTEVKIEFSGEFNLDDHPELKAAKEQFTSTKGKPITRWSRTSIEKKLEVIDTSNVLKTDLLVLATTSYYDDCSEALHATMYGCLFHIGAFRPEGGPKSKEDLVSSHYANLSSMFYVMASLLNELLSFIVAKENLKELDIERDKIDASVKELMFPLLSRSVKKNDP